MLHSLTLTRRTYGWGYDYDPEYIKYPYLNYGYEYSAINAILFITDNWQDSTRYWITNRLWNSSSDKQSYGKCCKSSDIKPGKASSTLFRYLCSFHRAFFRVLQPLFKQITKINTSTTKRVGRTTMVRQLLQQDFILQILPVVASWIYIQNGHRYSTLITAMLLLTKPFMDQRYHWKRRFIPWNSRI